MKDYLLFIDTEASGLPKDWSLPYDAEGNWPFCVQIAWIIYTRDGREIKAENHYIKDGDFEIAASATKIHGITRQFVNAHGQNRTEVLGLLVADVLQFQPLVVGHFLQFDLHMLAADFHRAAIENPLKKEASFCTMRGSRYLIKNPSVKFLRLGQLYETLFNKTFSNHHNAIADATATAACFFEMMKRGEIDETVIEQQQKEIAEKNNSTDNKGCFIPILIFISITILFFYL